MKEKRKKESFASRMRGKYNRASRFVEQDLWETQPREYKGVIRPFIFLLRIVILAAKRSIANKVMLRATALTFYTLMSVVPLLALVFAVAQGFSLETHVENLIRDKLSSYPEVVDSLVGFSSSLLARTGGGLIAGVGVLMLFWSVIKLFGHVERAFNAIWQVAVPRGWMRKMSDYLAMVILLPIMLIIASSSNILLQGFVKELGAQANILFLLKPIAVVIIRIVPLLVIAGLFALMFIAMPNTKVTWQAGLISGLVTAILFVMVQWLYFYFQIGVSNYNAIYGSFAALPLFLVWMQTSWQIVLLGGELSYAMQNVNLYNQEDTRDLAPRRAKELSLLIFVFIAGRYKVGSGSTSSLQIAEHFAISIRVVNRILKLLTECNLLLVVAGSNHEEASYVPAVTLDNCSPRSIFNAIDTRGVELPIPKGYEPLIVPLYDAYLAGEAQSNLTIDSLLAALPPEHLERILNGTPKANQP